MNTTTPPLNRTPALRSLLSSTPAGRGFLFVAVALAFVALSPTPEAFGVTPAPDGGYPNENTAEGDGALAQLTSGDSNTAIGFNALFGNTNGRANTASGDYALASNTTGVDNTANGYLALFNNTTGTNNTASGLYALYSNITGGGNTAMGESALFNNTTGGGNTASGNGALFNNTAGTNNTASGFNALFGCSFSDCTSTGNNNTATGANTLSNNNTGDDNTATGFNALFNNTSGRNNTAEGFQALPNNTTGSNNIALGANAGINLTSGNNNIVIGASGTAGESNTIRIGKDGAHKAAYMGGIRGATVASGVTVIVGASGHLGTIVSSQRFKDEIKPMDKASEAILELKPVTFRYKKELDPDGIPQFGLVAEEVEKVDPDLVARDAEGKVNTVRYEAVNAMLLNEFLKEHRRAEEQRKYFEAKFVQQQKQIEGLAATVQKVSAQLEIGQAAPQIVANNR